MFATACQSDAVKTGNVGRLDSVRTIAGVDLSLFDRDGKTITKSIYEYGGVRVRFPRAYRLNANSRLPVEAILINTAGGITGGDQNDYRISLEPGAQLCMTTQAFERIYRSAKSTSKLNIKLQLGAGSRLHWIPQGTLFYSGAKLKRLFDVDLLDNSEILLAESLIFGRYGMGETSVSGSIRDDWRIRRDGKLIFADSLKLEGQITEQLMRPAIGNGAHCLATLLFVSSDAEGKIGQVRQALGSISTSSGLSCWNGLMCVRFLSSHSHRMLADMACVMEILTERPIPRIWRT